MTSTADRPAAELLARDALAGLVCGTCQRKDHRYPASLTWTQGDSMDLGCPCCWADNLRACDAAINTDLYRAALRASQEVDRA